MTAGLGIDRLIDLIIEFFWWFVPFTVVNVYEEAVVLRWGHFQRVLKPGFHWIIPLGIEEVIAENVKPDGWTYVPYTIMLRDGVQLTITFGVIWRVVDVRTLVCEVEDKDTVHVAVGGTVAEWFAKHTWEDLSALRDWAAESERRHGIREKLINHINAEVTEWTGIHVDNWFLRDFAVAELKRGVVRLFQG